MRKFLVLFFTVFLLSIFPQGETDSPYDLDGWDSPADSTQYYGLYIFELLSNPGGAVNINTRRIDSLFNELIVFTDTTQLVIEDDTLRFSPIFVNSILDSAGLVLDFPSQLMVDNPLYFNVNTLDVYPLQTTLPIITLSNPLVDWGYTVGLNIPSLEDSITDQFFSNRLPLKTQSPLYFNGDSLDVDYGEVWLDMQSKWNTRNIYADMYIHPDSSYNVISFDSTGFLENKFVHWNLYTNKNVSVTDTTVQVGAVSSENLVFDIDISLTIVPTSILTSGEAIRVAVYIDGVLQENNSAYINLYDQNGFHNVSLSSTVQLNPLDTDIVSIGVSGNTVGLQIGVNRGWFKIKSRVH